jgi:ferredoxin-NADP reductase
MLSMLNWSLAHQPSREIWLFYGVRNAAEAVMPARLQQLAAAHPNFHLRICYSAPRPEDLHGQASVISGRVDIAVLREHLPLKPFEFYICGPAPMLESLVPALEAWGVPPSRIHFEAFGPSSLKRRQPSEETRAGEAEVTVTFTRSRKQISWRPSAGSLLEFAEANGVSVASGCRAGGCGSCQTTINTGEITYQQPPGYDPEPGTCLLCVCAPKTSVTLEA